MHQQEERSDELTWQALLGDTGEINPVNDVGACPRPKPRNSGAQRSTLVWNSMIASAIRSARSMAVTFASKPRSRALSTILAATSAGGRRPEYCAYATSAASIMIASSWWRCASLPVARGAGFAASRLDRERLANTPHHVTSVCDRTDCNVDYFDVTCN